MQIAYRGAGRRSMRAIDPTDRVSAVAAAKWLPDCLRRMGVVGAHTDIHCLALAGGVSSDIYRVELPSATICVKRALPKLRVAADWRAPVGRNRREAEREQPLREEASKR